MTSQARDFNSTASAHQNPFMSSEEQRGTFVSHVPLSDTHPTAGAGSVDTTSLPSQTATASSPFTTTSTTTTSTAPSSSVATAQGTTTDDVARAASQAQASVGEFVNKVTSKETKPGLAGNLAPDEKQIAPEQAPAGTEHVSNLLTGIGGAILSAPAAALEAVSPVAATKVSDAAAVISSKMPAVSLQDATNTASGLATAAYQKVPEGTAATVQSYVGAAVAKAQEVLPPALGGTTTTGNTGSGELAKPPSQLASEYGSASQQSLANAASSAQAYASSALSTAQQKAGEAAAVTQQKAGEAASVAQQKASEAGQLASEKAGQAQQRAGEVAGQASAAAQSTAQSARSTTQDYTGSAQAKVDELNAHQRQAGSSTATDFSSSSAAAPAFDGTGTATVTNTGTSGNYEYTQGELNAPKTTL